MQKYANIMNPKTWKCGEKRRKTRYSIRSLLTSQSVPKNIKSLQNFKSAARNADFLHWVNGSDQNLNFSKSI